MSVVLWWTDACGGTHVSYDGNANIGACSWRVGGVS
jgi:hypothetical protein